MDFDFVDEGTGPALLFLPGSYSNFAAWRAVQKELKGRYRLITTSLPGYGGSKEIRDKTVSDMSLMSDFVSRVVDRVGEPVHLVGHSFGGLTTLATVLSGKVKPSSVITFEANPINLRPEFGNFPWHAQTIDMYNSFEAAYASGDPDAPGIIIDFWGHSGIFKKMPTQFQDYCRSVVFTNVLDWRCALGFTPNVSAFSALDMLCTFAHGEHAVQPLKDITKAIAEFAPNSLIKEVKGSGHFLISTHPAECAVLIDDHMVRFEAQQG